MDRQYLNISLTGDNTVGGFRARINQTRDSPIINGMENYNMSVVRFEIPIGDIPLLFMPIEGGLLQNDVNKSIYKFTFEFNNNLYTRNVIYVPDNTTIPAPNPPSLNNGFQVITGIYYYLYNYQNLIDMFNTTLFNVFTDFKTANPLSPQTEAPYFILTDDQRLQLIVQPTYNDPLNRVRIYFNQEMITFFGNIQTFFTRLTQDAYAYIDTVEKINGSNWYWPPSTLLRTNLNYYLSVNQLTQELSSWADFRGIIVKTESMPIRSEAITSTVSQGNNITENILTDFSFNNWDGNRGYIQYSPTSPLRLLDIIGSGSLSNISISLFWRDKNNTLRPVDVFDQPVNMKLIFIKKGLVN